MHVETKGLAPAIREALRSVGYGGRDIAVVPAETIEAATGADRGQRGFMIMVNLDTGGRKVMQGSWGGSNMFVTTTDDVRESVPLPPNGVVLKGTTGYPRTFATLYANPKLVALLAPGGEDELTDEEQQAIYCFAAIKGGQYRRDELRRRGVAEAAVTGLVERGYLKQNKAGSIQITTKGKNARKVKW